MRQQLVAWAADCIVRGQVDLGDGRISDAVNEAELIRFEDATVEALDDGRIMELAEVEVERHDLHVIEISGQRGDPARRLRTVQEPVAMEIGPFLVTGSLHRAPNAAPLAALNRWARFVPVTGVSIGVRERPGGDRLSDVVLVNRDRIAKTDPLADFGNSPEELPGAVAAAI